MTTNEIHPSQEDLEKSFLLTVEDWLNTFKDWSGNQKDTECGIHTRIHTAAGSVTLSSSQDNYLLKLWISLELPQNHITKAIPQNHIPTDFKKKVDGSIEEYVNNTKS